MLSVEKPSGQQDLGVGSPGSRTGHLCLSAAQALRSASLDPPRPIEAGPSLTGLSAALAF